MNRRIGIFGGTFNPVHAAHYEIALQFVERFSLDLLYVVPNNIPPMKESHGVSGKERLEMLEIAFSGQDKIVISDTEIKRGGMSYTRDTVAELKEKHNGCELFLLIGDDWIDNFDRWRDYKYILDNTHLVVAYRGEKDISQSVARLNSVSGKEIRLLENERIDLSSTNFRNEPKKELLPDGVYDYIRKRGLYGI
jgi:nicotinate-nucleotide adenylyltransferase